MNDERQRINEIDEQVARLLQERATLARRIGELKAAENRPAYDPAREAEILRRVGETDGPLTAPVLQGVFAEIISACRALEQPVRVAFLGPENTFSHLAVQKKFGKQAVAVPMATITEIFRAVEAEQAHAGVVPVENSTGGVIPETLDCLLDTGLRICAEAHIPVHLCLLAPGPPGAGPDALHTPPPALRPDPRLAAGAPAGDNRWRSSPAPSWRPSGPPRTPPARPWPPPRRATPPICRCWAENIEDVPSNRTRFFVIAAQDARATDRDKTTPGVRHRAPPRLALRGPRLALGQRAQPHAHPVADPCAANRGSTSFSWTSRGTERKRSSAPP